MKIALPNNNPPAKKQFIVIMPDGKELKGSPEVYSKDDESAILSIIEKILNGDLKELSFNLESGQRVWIQEKVLEKCTFIFGIVN